MNNKYIMNKVQDYDLAIFTTTLFSHLYVRVGYSLSCGILLDEHIIFKVFMWNTLG
jgi:hypothetical protein